MLRYCLCMLAGAYSLGLFGRLPGTAYLTSVAAAAAICLIRAPLRMLAFFLIGLSLHWQSALSTLGDYLSPGLEGQTLQVTVVVADFPVVRGNAVRIIARTAANQGVPGFLLLSWHDSPVQPEIGETWSLRVRLRRPRGYLNPHGFDYEAWLFRQRIGATGYIVASERNRRLDDAPIDRTTRFRRHFVRRISKLLPRDDAAAVLLAIAVGARHRITRQQWDRYAVSGTSHLMAISGLHIGLAASAVFFLAWACAAAACRSANLRDVAMLAAMFAASAYTELSGFAVPARRAMLMAILASSAMLIRRRLDAANTLAVVCMLVIVSDPLSVLVPGFQLSFAAVALLLWGSRMSACGYRSGFRALDLAHLAVRRLSALQVLLLLGLFPLVAMIFGRVAWLAVPVNLLVLPVFNFVTVPAALLGMLLDGPLSPAGDTILRLCHASIRLVLHIVATLADWPAAQVQLKAFGPLVAALAILVAVCALLPPRWPGRRLAWIVLLAIVLHRPKPPPVGCFDVHVLDVGQGLAVVVQTSNHVAVYDAGPAFRSGSDTGELVVVPFLKKLGIRQLDVLIVSHADLDHAGGSESLERHLDVRRVLTGEELAVTNADTTLCEAGQAWQWDDVQFSIIHPVIAGELNGNDASCVLSVSAGSRRALLTGDIESRVERALLRRRAIESAYLVTVPHHGSRTSSSTAFIRAVNARIAVVSNGFRNRWGLPKDDVAERWRRAGTMLLSTADSGAVSQRLCRQGAAMPVRQQRLRDRRYWRQ